MSRNALVKAVGMHITPEQARKVYDYRIGQGEPDKVKVARGRTTQVMLACITLVQHRKIEQDGKGEGKLYRLA